MRRARASSATDVDARRDGGRSRPFLTALAWIAAATMIAGTVPLAWAADEPVHVGYAGPDAEGRTLWLRLGVDLASGDVSGTLRSSAPTAHDETEALDPTFVGQARFEPSPRGENAPATSPDRIVIDAVASDTAPPVPLTIVLEATHRSRPPTPDPHGSATVTA
ncbi:MAG: hypothetical protein WD336_01805 [Trueperaceae bacterium]